MSATNLNAQTRTQRNFETQLSAPVKAGKGDAKPNGKHSVARFYLPSQSSSQSHAKKGGWFYLTLILSLLLSLLSKPAFAITEAQFIEKVMANDKWSEEAQIGLDIKQIELDASRDNYANWKAELSADMGYSRTLDKQKRYKLTTGARSKNMYVKDIKKTPLGISLNVNKRFLSNPGSFSFGIDRSKDEVRNKRYKADDAYDTQKYGGYASAFYAQFKYPLLKHDGNAVSLKSYKRNIHDLQDQELSFLQEKEDFLNGRLNDYLSWVLYNRRVEINNALLLAVRGLQPADDAEAALLNSAIAQTENYKRDAQIQQQSMVERLAVLLDDATLGAQTPQFDLQKRVKLIKGNTHAYLAAHSRTLQRIHISQKLNELEVGYHKNRLLPSLNLTLRAEKEFDRAGTATLKYDDDTTGYEARLEFSYPLGGGVTTKAELAKRALSARRLEIIYAEKMESIEGELQRLTSLLDLDEQRLLDAIAAAQQSTKLEQQKYQQTRASIRDLLQAHRDERTAKLDHIDNLIKYQMRSIEYDNLLDRVIAVEG